jgi:DNA invertase Pin-like site-specific DNA recombinase
MMNRELSCFSMRKQDAAPSCALRNILHSGPGIILPGHMAVRTVTVSRLSDLARSSRDLLGVLQNRNIRFVILREGVDTSTCEGQSFVKILATIVEFERALQSEKIHEGLDRARRRGVQLGRRRKMAAEAGRHDPP